MDAVVVAREWSWRRPSRRCHLLTKEGGTLTWHIPHRHRYRAARVTTTSPSLLPEYGRRPSCLDIIGYHQSDGAGRWLLLAARGTTTSNRTLSLSLESTADNVQAVWTLTGVVRVTARSISHHQAARGTTTLSPESTDDDVQAVWTPSDVVRVTVRSIGCRRLPEGRRRCRQRVWPTTSKLFGRRRVSSE
jgi:hypothetical protein